MKRRLALVGLCIVVLLLPACVAKRVQMVPPSEALPEAGETATPAAPIAPPASNVILVDGELVNAYPLLKLAFEGNVSAKLTALHVEVGQRIKQGDLIAALDDGELQRAVEDARIALQRATEDRDKAEADAESKYQRAMEDAEDKYQREAESAEDKYQRDLEQARRALETARQNLNRAEMQPPTTAVAEARENLARAQDAEIQAEDGYRRALDRPWEPQTVRDSLYKDWQTRIKDRELAELRLKDAQTSLQAYYLDLEAKRQEVKNAEADLAAVKKDEVEKDEVEKDDVPPSYERAIADAEDKLAEAQEQLALAQLYAPWDALVKSIDTSVGATIGGGTPVVTLLNVRDIYFVTQNLSERHVAQIRQEQPATITLRTFPDSPLTGHVEVILPQLERKTDADARFTAYIRLDEHALDLLPGMTGRVEIQTTEDK